jgi:hypothetical protein
VSLEGDGAVDGRAGVDATAAVNDDNDDAAAAAAAAAAAGVATTRDTGGAVRGVRSRLSFCCCC